MNKKVSKNNLQKQYDDLNSYIKSGVYTVINLLKDEGFVDGDFSDETTLKLSLKGKIAYLKQIFVLSIIINKMPEKIPLNFKNKKTNTDY